jgi:hypothetical protein
MIASREVKEEGQTVVPEMSGFGKFDGSGVSGSTGRGRGQALESKVRLADLHVSHLSSGGHGCPWHARESVQVITCRMLNAQRMPLGIGSCARQNQTSICCLRLRRAVTED